MSVESPLTFYYQTKIDELDLQVRERTQNLRRLEAQRNELNGKGASRGLASVQCARCARRSSTCKSLARTLATW
jgi:hypothetical protein